MKSYSFYFNTSDWLASPAVRMMSKAERGVYIGLLALAWESPVQGTLPASTDKVRRLAEMSLDEWAESGETLLDKFPLSECGTYRYNPRLLAEATKEQARSDKAKKSADMRWQSERNANASKNNANASEKVCERNAQVKVSKGTTNVVEKAVAPEALKVKSKSEVVAGQVATDGTATFTAETWLGLNDPHQFATICRSLTALKLPANLDTEAYRESIRRKVADRGMNVPAPTMRNFIESFFMKLPTAELRTLDAAMPTVPTPKHELPQARMERPGQIIAIAGVAHDDSMNRMKIATHQGYWPTAKIHVVFPR